MKGLRILHRLLKIVVARDFEHEGNCRFDIFPAKKSKFVYVYLYYFRTFSSFAN